MCRIRERPVDHARGYAVPAQQLPERPRANGIRPAVFFFDQAKTNQRLGEAEIRKQVERLIRAGHDVARGRIDVGLVRELAGGNGRPDRCRLRRPKRGQMHHGAAVEEAREVWKSPACGIRGNEVERSSVEQNHANPQARLGWRELRRNGFPRRRRIFPEPAKEQRTRQRQTERDPEHRRDEAASAPQPGLYDRKRGARCGAERDDNRAFSHPRSSIGAEHAAKAVQVQPRDERADDDRQSRECREQAKADPARRAHFHREQLTHDDQAVEKGRRVNAVERRPRQYRGERQPSS